MPIIPKKLIVTNQDTGKEVTVHAGKYQVLEPLTEDEYAALRDSISQSGVAVSIEVDETGAIIDGHHRYAIWECLHANGHKINGKPIPPPGVKVINGTKEQNIDRAYLLNCTRRHITNNQKRTLIEKYTQQYPDKSDREIARNIGVSNSTVSSLRRVKETQKIIKESNMETVVKEVGKLSKETIKTKKSEVYDRMVKFVKRIADPNEDLKNIREIARDIIRLLEKLS